MPNKSLILYSSREFSKGCQIISAYDSGNAIPIYIRTEVFDGDIAEALDKAKPRAGETVLNTIPV